MTLINKSMIFIYIIEYSDFTIFIYFKILAIIITIKL